MLLNGELHTDKHEAQSLMDTQALNTVVLPRGWTRVMTTRTGIGKATGLDLGLGLGLGMVMDMVMGDDFVTFIAVSKAATVFAFAFAGFKGVVGSFASEEQNSEGSGIRMGACMQTDLGLTNYAHTRFEYH